MCVKYRLAFLVCT